MEWGERTLLCNKIKSTNRPSFRFRGAKTSPQPSHCCIQLPLPVER